MKVGEYELNNIYHCNSEEIIKSLPDKCIDLIITDPPYGINMDKGTNGGGSMDLVILKKKLGNIKVDGITKFLQRKCLMNY